MHLSMAVSMDGASGDAAPAPPAVNPNLLTKTEQFDAAAWVKTSCSVSANAGTDPLGGRSADQVAFSLGTGSIGQTSAAAAASGSGSLSIGPNATLRRWSVTATLDTGQYTYSIWAWDPDTAGSSVTIDLLVVGGFIQVKVGDLGDLADIFLWGAKLEVGNVATGDATNYGAVA